MTGRNTRAANENGSVRSGQGGADDQTDYSRWRLLNDCGRQTWHYLTAARELEQWPQSIADKYHLGLPTGLPELPRATSPVEAAENGLSFLSHLQLPPGNWACEYGGPMFLLPGLVVTWYVTGTSVPPQFATEIKRYLFARQHPKDGGWGLHIEAHSSVFGTAMNYTALRLLGASAEDPRMIKARGLLHKFGGAVYGPHWAKFWLSVLGVMEWECVNPLPPELWLLPDWVPFAPWRWWVHMRQVFLPMAYIYSRRFSHPLDGLTSQLRQELYTEPYEAISFASYRGTIAKEDNHSPKSWILNVIFWFVVNIWNVYLRWPALVKKAEDRVWYLIQREDENTDYADLGPVNASMNTICCYIHDGPGSFPVHRHLDRLHDFLWMKSEGMLMNGTNGVQVWDTAFIIQAAVVTGFANDTRWRPMLMKALEFLEAHQMLENIPEEEKCYRFRAKGAWPFSTKVQGYTVSDCTAEALRAVLQLQNQLGFTPLILQRRLKDAVDTLLEMQHDTGGFADYEPTRASRHIEFLNAAEVFNGVIVGSDFTECTAAAITALSYFSRFYPDYRVDDIKRAQDKAVAYIRRAQEPDGSWYGSWGICFTYAAMFALEALAMVGETYETSQRARRGCQFLLDKQMADGGWGESYHSSVSKTYTHSKTSQVVQTAWASLALMEAGYPNREPLRRAMNVIMLKQQPNGEWLQEGIEGVFNQSCMISYPNYKLYWPVRALGLYAKKFGNEDIL
ncbi:squalene/oxidosqualene cyclase [Coccidioides immitis RS]|uniref:Terpene cyclase/mutase family member n=3 Tax=Coccidioides immitis TaxID=5501 RepID=J3K8L2_COCIM|nr:squalene/oxidosqualene cyclase [Coccidioides immitis RS]EAS31167.3 squalene/oxidosqualene cyclase [Coccidioides immitis RS]KMP03780.1 lanosterol synthase [Coccidioides immitis RMSCC 2394]KMU74755.1 lanosterol synthase [Coccidioides immitis RMSCC 3703]